MLCSIYCLFPFLFVFHSLHSFISAGFISVDLSSSSLIAQLVKNLPAMQETSVQFLVCKIPWRRDQLPTLVSLGSPHGSYNKESAHNVRDLGSILGLEDPLEKGKAPHYSILAWRIPWTVQSIGWQRVEHNWTTCTFTPTSSLMFLWCVNLMLSPRKIFFTSVIMFFT